MSNIDNIVSKVSADELKKTSESLENIKSSDVAMDCGLVMLAYS